MLEKQYTDAIAVEEGILLKLHRSSKILLWGKLITFGVSLYSFYQFIFEHMNPTKGWLALLFFGLYLLIMYIDNKLQCQIDLHENIKKKLQREIAYLKGDFSELESGEEFMNPKHPYTYDMDVFGEKSLFHRIDRTVSSVGKKRLAERLSHLELDLTRIKENQIAIQELANKFSWRILFLSFGINSSYNLRQLAVNMKSAKDESFFQTGLFKTLVNVASVITITCVILTIYDIVPVSLASGLFIGQLIVASMLSKKMKAISQEVDGLLKGLRPYRQLVNHIQQEKFTSKVLDDLQSQFTVNKEVNATQAFRQLSRTLDRLNERGNLLTHILFNGLVLSDLRIITDYYTWKRMNQEHMNNWVDVIAEFDMFVSLSFFAFNHPETRYPEVVDSPQIVLEAQNMYHPFLGKQAVSNDFMLNQNTYAIVTGANMAGKSTFLRSVGINFIMGHIGLPVCADSFVFTPMKLFSSMRTTDNLVENISYFNAELIRLENLIEYCQSNKHTLIILDEILKGTNSNDKLNGSKLLLKTMAQLPVSGVVATHDLELTELGNDSTTYFNYCFEIELLEDIKYTYKMTPGVAKNLNATFLLKKILNKLEHQG